MGLLLGLWVKFKTWFLIAAGVLATLLVAYAKGRGDGKNSTESQRLKDRLEAIIEAEKIEQKTNSADDAQLDRDLGKWVRDKER